MLDYGAASGLQGYELLKCKTFLITNRQGQKVAGNVISVTASQEQEMGIFKSDSDEDCGEMWRAWMS